MRQAAIGVRVHSGWGALVAAAADSSGEPEILERKHITIIDLTAAGAKQPYHFAANLALRDAEKHLSECAVASRRLAAAAVGTVLEGLRGRGYEVVGCALLLGSGRALPSLPDILASHALIHTAEGEFFRLIFREAFDRLGVRVTGFREREVEDGVAPPVLQRISGMGKVVGAPWTADEKLAALAAWMLLGGE